MLMVQIKSVASGAITRSDAVDAFVPIAAPMRTDPTFSNSGSLTFIDQLTQ